MANPISSQPGANILLQVRNLRVEFRTRRSTDRRVAVRGVSFRLERGEVLALSGVTGSGKTATILALSGLLPKGAQVVAGEALLDGTVDLLSLSAKELRKLRSTRIAYLFREAESQLDPRFPIRQHLMDAIELAGRSLMYPNGEESWMQTLYDVGLADPESVLDALPSTLSRVVLQRVMLAMALLSGAELLIADEPTADLDSAAEAQILEVFRRLCKERDLTILLVTNDFALVAGAADRVAVMYDGGIVETGDAGVTTKKPKNAYTKALLECVPRLGVRRERLGRLDEKARLAAEEALATVKDGVDIVV